MSVPDEEIDRLYGLPLDEFTRARDELARRVAAALDRVLATLRSGSLTEDGRAFLKSGRLTEELEPPGFEALAGLDMQAGRPRPRPAEKVAPAATRTEKRQKRE